MSLKNFTRTPWKKFGKSETFYRSKFSRATGVTPMTGWILGQEIQAQICNLDSASSILPILSVEIE